eukprot:365664-Chlamydomonas_euryale.AAC.3
MGFVQFEPTCVAVAHCSCIMLCHPAPRPCLCVCTLPYPVPTPVTLLRYAVTTPRDHKLCPHAVPTPLPIPCTDHTCPRPVTLPCPPSHRTVTSQLPGKRVEVQLVVSRQEATGGAAAAAAAAMHTQSPVGAATHTPARLLVGSVHDDRLLSYQSMVLETFPTPFTVAAGQEGEGRERAVVPEHGAGDVLHASYGSCRAGGEGRERAVVPEHGAGDVPHAIHGSCRAGGGREGEGRRTRAWCWRRSPRQLQ